MKKITKALAVIMVLAVSAAAFAACGSSSSSKSDSKAESSASQKSEGSKSEDSKPEGDVDYNNPTATLGEGDYEAMMTYAKEMQSNGHKGEVVRITGINSRSNFGAKASVLISDGGSKKIGPTYKIDGAASIDDYPANDATVEVTGVVTLEEGGLGCYIAVPADKVVTK